MKTITPTTSQLRMLSSIRAQQWMIRPDAVQDYALSALEIGEKRADCEEDDCLSDFFTKRTPAYIDSAGIGHIQIRGALVNKCPAIYERWSLATLYSTIITECQAMKQGGALGVVFHVDSPGGTVSGVIEAGDAIATIGIPSVTHCDGMACSAAYWLASGTSLILATPSATVGNIGAIITWADCDEFWAQMGVEFKALTSEGADLKSTFHLEPDAIQTAFLQESINDAGALFREHVLAGRPYIDPECFRAGWYSGQKAESLKLIDQIGDSNDAIDAIKGLAQTA